MALKLKLKVNPSASREDSQENDQPALPRIKIKPPRAEPTDGVSKPKKKEKLKKLKISLGKALLSSQISDTPTSSSQTQPILKRVPKVRIKPTRIPGEGYDSEAPDIEDDPLIEQGIVVRFANDVNLDFIHNAADTGDFSNVNIKWITRDKAVVNVNLTLYSARLIDLPTLTELYKTVDKKNIFKTIDISQVLLVLHQINPKQLNMDQDFEVPEEYTYVHPLYKLSVNKEIRNTKSVYRNGLAYAYEDVYRRFRPKKTNPRVMADIELRVDELVRRDQDAQESHYEYVDSRAPTHKYGGSSSQPPASVSTTPRPRMEEGDRMEIDREEEEEDEDEHQIALDLEADIDNVLEQELAEALDSTSNNTAATVLMKSEFDNEDGASDAGEEEEQADDDDDDDEEEEEEEEDEDEDEDEDTKQDKSRVKKLEEEISDLERAADKQKVLLATASFKMMRMKFQSAYNNLKGQLDQKKRELAKIREQQQKSQMTIVPNTKNDEEDDEEDEDDEDEDEENDHDEGTGPQDSEVSESVAKPTEFTENDNEADADDDDNDDIDDFGGLF